MSEPDEIVLQDQDPDFDLNHAWRYENIINVFTIHIASIVSKQKDIMVDGKFPEYTGHTLIYRDFGNPNWYPFKLADPETGENNALELRTTAEKAQKHLNELLRKHEYVKKITKEEALKILQEKQESDNATREYIANLHLNSKH